MRPSFLSFATASLALVCAALTACSTIQPLPYSGIDASSQLRPNSRDPSGRMPYEYRRETTQWEKYSAFTMDPVEIYRGADSQFEDISEDDKAFLAHSMRVEFSEKLRPRFRPSVTASADTLRIKLTLTGAKSNTAVLSTLSRFDLLGGPYNAVQAARGKEGAMTGSVSFAVEIYDSSTNALLAAYVSKQYPNAWNLKAGIGAMSASLAGIQNGADQLVAYLR